MTTPATRPAAAGRRAPARGALLGLAALAAALAAAFPAPAAAQEGAQHHHPGINCRCRANGHDYELGERACLRMPAGPRLAECRMEQNVTSWSVVPGTEGCGEVSRLEAPGAGVAEASGG